MPNDPKRPYPEGIAWDEAWRQRQRADLLEKQLKRLKPLEFENYVCKYGQLYEFLIADALSFLDERETSWCLDEPIDRDEYIEGLIKAAKKGRENGKC
jgi:hypothetical protein